MSDADISAPQIWADPARKRYVLDDRGFREVPEKWRKFYRHWGGPGDDPAPNEVVCPVCKVVIRAAHELRPGDKVYCMPCMAQLVVRAGENGRFDADVIF